MHLNVILAVIQTKNRVAVNCVKIRNIPEYKNASIFHGNCSFL